jgi:membrane-associated phospholipid phosphatase
VHNRRKTARLRRESALRGPFEGWKVSPVTAKAGYRFLCWEWQKSREHDKQWSAFVGVSTTLEQQLKESRLISWRWGSLVLFSTYLLVVWQTIGLRVEHVVVSLGFIALAWIGPRGREFSYRALPLFATAALYEGQRYWLHLRGPINVGSLYRAEQRWFGLTVNGKRLTLPEYFHTRTVAALDFICGFAYLTYLYQYVLIALYFYLRDRQRFSRMAWGFLLVNLLGMLTYVLYPAAPPWYVIKYGLGVARMDVPPDPAGTLAFDQMLGISYFQQFYARNANVFGAMPSLHVAYPVLACCASASKGRWWGWSTGVYAVLVAFSAVYLRHHYVWDVVMGLIYGMATYGALRMFEARRKASTKTELSATAASTVAEG